MNIFLGFKALFYWCTATYFLSFWHSGIQYLKMFTMLLISNYSKLSTFLPSFFSHSSWWKYIKNLKHRGTKLSIKEQLNKLLLVQFFVFCKFWAHLFVEAFDFGNLKWMNSQKIMLTKYSLAKVPIFEHNTFCNRILVYNIKRHPNSMMIFWIKCYFVIKENITN